MLESILLFTLVFFCGALLGTIIVGNVYEEAFKELYEDEDEDEDYCGCGCDASVEELEEDVDGRLTNLERAQNNTTTVCSRILEKVVNLSNELDEHKHGFAHPYKTEKEIKLEKAKAVKEAFLNLLNEYELDIEDVMDEMPVRKPTKKSNK